MYKPHSKNTLSAQLGVYQRISPTPSPIQAAKPPNYTPKFDLKKFNDYLQDRISRKVVRNDMEMSRRDSSQKRSVQAINYKQITVDKNMQKDHGLQKFRESRIQKSREILTPKISWRKHESIDKLLGKQNQILLNANRKTDTESQESALRELQRKYQELQQNYKTLMRQASQKAREFQTDKTLLNKMKMAHLQDQQILLKLRKELLMLHQNMNKKIEDTAVLQEKSVQKSVMKCKSQQIIQSDHSTILGSLQPIHQMWRSKQVKEQKMDYNRFSRNKTSQNWKTNFQKSIVAQSQQKARPKQSRYYSAEKMAESVKKASKAKKGSEHLEYNTIESKTSIKYVDSMRGSKVRVSAKPATETLIRLENQFAKNGASSTLQKKMITSNPYAKYRFQPSYKFQ